MVISLRDEGNRKQVLIAGSTAGLVSRFFTAPLDVLKVRLQISANSIRIHDTLKTIIRQEGFTALWKGNIPAEGLYICYGAVQFSAYRATSQYLRRYHKGLSGNVNAFVSGATAGTIATSCTYPLDLLRTRFAATGKIKVYSSLSTSILEIFRHEGSLGLFRGLSAANLQIIPYMGLFFTFYEGLKPRLNEANYLPLQWMGSGDGVAGVMAGIMSKSMVYPLDTARKRLQLQGPNRTKYVYSDIPEYRTGSFGVIRTIIVKEGVLGLYRGLSIALLKSAPASAVTLWTYERVMTIFRHLEK